MLGSLSTQQKKVLAIARNCGTIKKDKILGIYKKKERGKKFIEFLTEQKVLIFDKTNRLFLYNDKLDEHVLQALGYTPEKRKLFKEVLPWVK